MSGCGRITDDGGGSVASWAGVSGCGGFADDHTDGARDGRSGQSVALCCGDDNDEGGSRTGRCCCVGCGRCDRSSDRRCGVGAWCGMALCCGDDKHGGGCRAAWCPVRGGGRLADNRSQRLTRRRRLSECCGDLDGCAGGRARRWRPSGCGGDPDDGSGGRPGCCAVASGLGFPNHDSDSAGDLGAGQRVAFGGGDAHNGAVCLSGCCAVASGCPVENNRRGGVAAWCGVASGCGFDRTLDCDAVGATRWNGMALRGGDDHDQGGGVGAWCCPSFGCRYDKNRRCCGTGRCGMSSGCGFAYDGGEGASRRRMHDSMPLCVGSDDDPGHGRSRGGGMSSGCGVAYDGGLC